MNPEICPSCRGELAEGGPVEVDGSYCTQERGGLDCDTTVTVVFSFYEFRNIEGSQDVTLHEG